MDKTLLIILVLVACSFLAFATKDDKILKSRNQTSSENLAQKPHHRQKRFVVWPFVLAAAIAAAVAGGTAGGVIEHKKSVQRERTREERARELQERLDRICPSSCWNSWPSSWGSCSQQCGGGGIKWQHRSPKSGFSLGECQSWVSRNGCPGPSSRSSACNRVCQNGGIPVPTGCRCQSGWTGTCCEQRVTCPSPQRPASGSVSTNGRVPSGTTVRYSCYHGYTLSGPQTSTCVHGRWTNQPPTCNVVSCGRPPTPANGQVRLVLKSQYVYQSSVNVTCNHGYRLHGNQIRHCEANGRWSGTAPSCELIECPSQQPPSNGNVAYPSGRNLADKLVYSCNSGFVLQGTSERLCQSNGHWTSGSATCNQILCNNLAAPANGGVTHSRSSGGKTPFGQKAAFSCNQGYVLEGSAALTCTWNNMAAKFDGRPPVCRPINCSDPGHPTNGIQRSSGHLYGQVVSFMCDAGHYLQGHHEVRCEHTRRWTHEKPQCPACPSDTYKPGTNNDQVCKACPENSSTQNVTAASEKTQCLCKRGYKGQPGGPCAATTCPHLLAPTNGHEVSCSTKLDGKCIFECDDGFFRSQGESKRTCSESETWSGSDVKCDACPINTYKVTPTHCEACPNNSHTIGNATTDKKGCVCNDGYNGPPGGPCRDVDECAVNNGGCEQTCVNQPGRYSCKCTNIGSVKDIDDFKKCVPKNQCPYMTKPANGGVVCYAQRNTNTEYCNVKCNKGFEHVIQANAYEQCGPSTNWKWSHELNNKPIFDCVPAHFPRIQVSIAIMYFTDDCANITETERKDVKVDFVDLLSQRNVCMIAGHKKCSIEDVDVECGTTSTSTLKSRVRRDTDYAQDELIVRFNLVSEEKAMPTDRDCDEECREAAMTEAKKLILMQEKSVSDIMSQSGSNTTVTLGGIDMEPTTRMTMGEPEPSCGKGTTYRNGTCVTILCGLPIPPTNGGMNVSGHLYTNITTFNCSQYYALKGDSSTKCQADGEWSIYDTSCVHYKDLQYDCMNSNPCNPQRVPNRSYYRHTDGNKFIYCGAGGICSEKTCPPPLLWNNELQVCVW